MSSRITKDDIAHLARLGNVSLTPTEADQLVGELSVVLEYIAQLRTLDTDGVEPTYQLGGLSNVWREDKVDERPISREALLDLAPSIQDNQIKVPKVL